MNWNDYYMNMASGASLRSKDPVTKVGAVVVNPHMEEVATGYNGFPKGRPEPPDLWERPHKYSRVIHAEANAIYKALRREELHGCILYSTLQPCCECLKMIAAVGIDQVFFMNEMREAAESYQLAKFFGITLEQI